MIVDFSLVGSVVSVDGFQNEIFFQGIRDLTSDNPVTSAGPAAIMIQQPPNGENGQDAHSFQFIFPVVPPGQHDISIEYKVGTARSPVPSGATDQWIMTVHHR